MEYILGIDIGTGSTKAVAVGVQDQEAFASSQNFYPTSTPQPGYSEQDPEMIWKAFEDCIREIIAELGHAPAALSLSSAMHSVIAVDEQGKALAPMMTWADSRSTAIADALLAGAAGPALYTQTGTPIHSMSPLCKISWIREQDPDLFQRTYKFISIKEYIWYRLFGVFEVDHSIASCTGLMNVRTLQWSSAAMQTAGISSKTLSALVPVSHIRKAEGLDFLAAGTPVVIGASDGCLANLGTGSIHPGIAALTIGTSGALRVASHQSVFNEKAMTFSYRLDEETFINGGPVNNGGVALKWHLKNLFQTEDLKEEQYTKALLAIGQVPAGAGGLLFLPYLQGERAPIWDSKSCGTFFGMRLTHQPAHFTRAVIEGICFALNDVLQSLMESGQQITQLNVSGGFVTSAFWLQILADITGKKLMLASTEDASAVGAAYVALKALGYAAGYPLPQKTGVRYILPDRNNHKKYQQYFEVYKKLYVNLKNLMGEMYILQQQ